MKKILVWTLALAVLAGCGARPPELSGHLGKEFPVYAPSKVESAMGAETGASVHDPKASHHLTYWLVTEDKPEDVVAFYKEKMKTLPDAKDVPEDEKFEGALLMFRCGAISEKEKVESYEVIVEKAEQGDGCEFRVKETLVPGLKYPD